MIEEGNNRRLDYMDIAKGFGIICVIIGHMENSAINRFVFSFHMPLFFIVSGYFLSEKYSSKEILVKRSKQLLPPYVFTCVCVMTLSVIKNLIGILLGSKKVGDLISDLGKWFYASIYGAGASYDEPFQIVQIGAIWFLLAMILGTYIVQKIRKIKYPEASLIIVALIGYFTSKLIWLPWSVQAAMTAAVFIYFGVLLRKYNAFEKKYQKAIFPVALLFWINEIIHGDPYLSIVRNCYPNGAFDFIGGGCGAICIIIIAKYLCEHLRCGKMWDVCRWVGRNSLIILCVHLIELNIVPWSSILGLFGITECLFIPIIILKLLWAFTGTWIINHMKLRCIFGA